MAQCDHVRKWSFEFKMVVNNLNYIVQLVFRCVFLCIIITFLVNLLLILYVVVTVYKSAIIV